MSKGSGIDLGLNEAYNDLFSTQEERDNAGRTFIIDLVRELTDDEAVIIMVDSNLQ